MILAWASPFKGGILLVICIYKYFPFDKYKYMQPTFVCEPFS